jgi:hypothetical protein
MQLRNLKVIFAVPENAEVRVKILEKRLLMPRIHMLKRAFVQLVLTQPPRRINLTHVQTKPFHKPWDANP